MLEAHELDEALAAFYGTGLITEVLFEVKSGKEATVVCCRGGAPLDHQLAAAKIYREADRRFQSDSLYTEGRMARNTRPRRAIEKGTEFGRRIQLMLWLEHEWETLNHLFDAGLDVPCPLERSDKAILMEFVGSETEASPRLSDVDVPDDLAPTVFDRLLWNIESMLDVHRVHGDLSPYNVLLADDEPVVIDFPQAVDPRLNSSARMLLQRDVDRVCQWGAKHGDNRDAASIAQDLWRRFRLGEIGA